MSLGIGMSAMNFMRSTVLVLSAALLVFGHAATEIASNLPLGVVESERDEYTSESAISSRELPLDTVRREPKLKKKRMRKPRLRITSTLSAGAAHETNPFTLGQIQIEKFPPTDSQVAAGNNAYAGMKSVSDWHFPLSGKIQLDYKHLRLRFGISGDFYAYNSSKNSVTGKLTGAYVSRDLFVGLTWSGSPAVAVRPTYIAGYRSYGLDRSERYEMMKYAWYKAALTVSARKFPANPSLIVSCKNVEYTPHFRPYDYLSFDGRLGCAIRKKLEMRAGLNGAILTARHPVNTDALKINCNAWESGIDLALRWIGKKLGAGISGDINYRIYTASDPDDSYYNRNDLTVAIEPSVSFTWNKLTFEAVASNKFRNTTMPDPARDEAKDYYNLDAGVSITWQPVLAIPIKKHRRN